MQMQMQMPMQMKEGRWASGHVKRIGMCRGKSLKLIGLCPPQTLVVSRAQSGSARLTSSQTIPSSMTLMALKLLFICSTAPPLKLKPGQKWQHEWDTNLSPNSCIQLFMGFATAAIYENKAHWHRFRVRAPDTCVHPPMACII